MYQRRRWAVHGVNKNGSSEISGRELPGHIIEVVG